LIKNLIYSFLIAITSSITFSIGVAFGQTPNNKEACACILTKKKCQQRNTALITQHEAQVPMLLTVLVDVDKNPELRDVNQTALLFTDVLINFWLSKRTASDTISRNLEEGDYTLSIDYYINLAELEGGPVLLSMSLVLNKATSDEYVTLLFCSNDLRDELLRYNVMKGEESIDLLRYFEQAVYTATSHTQSKFDKSYPCGFMK
jgi:hypothetical protein